MPFSAEDWAAIALTLRLAATTTVLLLVLCTPIAWWLATTRSRWRGPVGAIVALPLVLPPTVVGWLLLDEKISWMSILGAVLITLGVIFANKSTEK